MILIDTSIWIAHLRTKDETVDDLSRRRRVLSHPLVLGELAMGTLQDRPALIFLMQNLPQARSFDDTDVLRFVERRRLYGRGIGYIDAHLLLSASATEGASLWTRDKRLLVLTAELGLLPPIHGAQLQ